jgi:hypothetical protein
MTCLVLDDRTGKRLNRCALHRVALIWRLPFPMVFYF